MTLQYKFNMGDNTIMTKNYMFTIYSDITKALKHHNEIMPSEKFTTLDGNILCLVKSFSDNGLDFFMSEKEIAETNITSEKTVQRSVNRLCKANLLKKEKLNGRRILVYQESNVHDLLKIE